MPAEKPLFIPLKRDYFEDFENGRKVIEYRKRGPRWNAETCRIGRRVVLSLGYGRHRRLEGTVAGFFYDKKPQQRKGFTACYGPGPAEAACITVALDKFARPI